MAKRAKPAASPPPRAPAIWLRAAIVVIAGILTYSNSLSGPFVFDDELSVVYNASIRQLGDLGRVLFPEQDSSVAGRPLVNISFAINYAIGTLNVRGYHIWNIAVHLLCGLLVFGVVRRTLALPNLRARFGPRATAIGFATSLLWTLHPLNSEAVNYLTQRTESMMALAYLLTLYASLRATSSNYPTWWQGAAVVACALGMACKESMVTAPVMVVLYDRIFVFESLTASFRARRRFYVGLSATWIVLAALIGSGPRGESAGFSNDVTPWTYLLNQTVMIPQYLSRAVWPRSLVINYGFPLPLTLAEVLPSALLVASLVVAAAVSLVVAPRAGFLAAWVFVTLAPMSSVVPIATEVGAERRMYLPLVAIVVLVVVVATMVWDVVKKRWLAHVASTRPGALAFAGTFALVVVSASLTAVTFSRNREYESGLTLIRTTVERWPTAVSRHMLGGALVVAGRDNEAIPHLRAAIAGAPRARYDLGIALFNQGKFDEAVEQLSALIAVWSSPPAVHPRWQPPLRMDAIAARELIGRALARQARWDEAADQFRRVLAMDPTSRTARGLLAAALFAQQAYDDAIDQYRAHLKEQPNDVEALGNLGIALVAAGKLDDAVEPFRRAVELDPRNGGAERNLANALFDSGDVNGAALHAQQAVELRPDDPAAHDLLGRALALQGKLSEAASRFERALQIDPAYADARQHLRQLQQISGPRRR